MISQTSIISYFEGQFRGSTKALKRLRQDLAVDQDEKGFQSCWFTAFRELKATPVENVVGVLTDLMMEFQLSAREKLANKNLAESFRVLFEFKKATLGSEKSLCIKALVQCLCYHVSMLEKNPDSASKIQVFAVATQERIWCFPAQLVLKHAELVKTTKNPSKSKLNEAAVKAVQEDAALKPFLENIFKVSDSLFTLENVREHFIACCKRMTFKIPVKPDNVFSWLDKFREHVIGDRTPIDSVPDDKEEALRSQIAAFLQCISVLRVDDVCMSGSKDIQYGVGKSTRKFISAVSRENVENFIKAFRAIDDETRKKIIQNADQCLKHSQTRQRRGDYYTPLGRAEHACEVIDGVVGEDWTSSAVVWDASCGTGNLTAERSFDRLIQTTLFDEDIGLINARDVNRTAHREAFDFLSGIDNVPRIVTSSVAAKETKQFVFFNNPPFVAGAVLTNNTSETTKRKRGVSQTVVGNAMKLQKFKTDNLQYHFMHKITMLASSWKKSNKDLEIYNAIFLPTNALCSSQNEKFLRFYFSKWEFCKGFVFPASEFLGTKGNDWSVCFTLWKFGGQATPQLDISLELRQYVNAEDVVLGETHVRLVPQLQSLNSWMKGVAAPLTVECLPLTNGLQQSFSQKKFYLPSNSLGYIVSSTNAVKQNKQQVYIFSSVRGNGHGSAIVDGEKLFRVCAAFFVRRALLPSNREMWKVWHYDYSAPQKTPSRQWTLNCLVYSLFDGKSSQSSLRKVEHVTDGVKKSYDVKNEFFFLSRATMSSMAEEVGFTELYRDATSSKTEAKVYKIFSDRKDELYDESVQLLSHMETLWRSTMKKRHEAKETYHLHCWDAGWLQISKLLANDEKSAAKECTKKLRDKLFDGIEQYGFLPKLPELESVSVDEADEGNTERDVEDGDDEADDGEGERDTEDDSELAKKKKISIQSKRASNEDDDNDANDNATEQIPKRKKNSKQ